jgi:hypothetical protein
MSTATAEPDTALGESIKRRLPGWAGLSVLITASVGMLVAGILIGNAARKRVDKLSHGIS